MRIQHFGRESLYFQCYGGEGESGFPIRSGNQRPPSLSGGTRFKTAVLLTMVSSDSDGLNMWVLL